MQGATLDELRENLREVVTMLLEDGDPYFEAEFIGTQSARSEISFGTRNPASAIAWSAPAVIFCVTAKIADGLRSLVKS